MAAARVYPLSGEATAETLRCNFLSQIGSQPRRPQSSRKNRAANQQRVVNMVRQHARERINVRTIDKLFTRTWGRPAKLR